MKLVTSKLHLNNSSNTDKERLIGLAVLSLLVIGLGLGLGLGKGPGPGPVLGSSNQSNDQFSTIVPTVQITDPSGVPTTAQSKVPTTDPRKVSTNSQSKVPSTAPSEVPKTVSSEMPSNIPVLSWKQLGQDIDGNAKGDRSGESLSLSQDGNTLAIGAPRNDGNGYRSGHVRVYQFSSVLDKWAQLGQDIDGEASDNWSGWSVSLSQDGNILAIGAPFNNGNGYRSGHVRVYQYQSGLDQWVQLGKDIDGQNEDDWSGQSISLSQDGNILAIGAPLSEVNGSKSGYVRIYQYSLALKRWVQLGQDIVGEATRDKLGESISLSQDGNILAIGAPFSEVNGSDSGYVRVYQHSLALNKWVQLGQDLVGKATDNLFGQSVSLSKDGIKLAISAPGYNKNGSNSGSVRVYQYSSALNNWVQIGKDIDGNDLIVRSLSLSGNGNILGVGDPYSEAYGSRSGNVRVYKYSSVLDTWVQLGQDMYGSHLGEQYGYSVSLSQNGNIIAIGAPQNTQNEGYVQIYHMVNV